MNPRTTIAILALLATTTTGCLDTQYNYGGICLPCSVCPKENRGEYIESDCMANSPNCNFMCRLPYARWLPWEIYHCPEDPTITRRDILRLAKNNYRFIEEAGNEVLRSEDKFIREFKAYRQETEGITNNPTAMRSAKRTRSILRRTLKRTLAKKQRLIDFFEY